MSGPVALCSRCSDDEPCSDHAGEDESPDALERSLCQCGEMRDDFGACWRCDSPPLASLVAPPERRLNPRPLHCDEMICGAALRCSLPLGHRGDHAAPLPNAASAAERRPTDPI